MHSDHVVMRVSFVNVSYFLSFLTSVLMLAIAQSLLSMYTLSFLLRVRLVVGFHFVFVMSMYTLQLL